MIDLDIERIVDLIVVSILDFIITPHINCLSVWLQNTAGLVIYVATQILDYMLDMCINCLICFMVALC